jgi:hypothetical protein
VFTSAVESAGGALGSAERTLSALPETGGGLLVLLAGPLLIAGGTSLLVTRRFRR